MNYNKIFASVSMLVAVLAVTFLFTAATDKNGYAVGDEAKDFNLKNIDGKMISLAGMEDAKGYIVTFTCNHCPYAKLYEDRLIALHNQFAEKGYPVVAINPNVSTTEADNFEAMIERAKEKSFPFVYLSDEDQSIAKTYGATKTPHVYVISKNKGKLKVEYIGAIDDNPKSAEEATETYVADAVDALLADKKVKKKEAKAVGCGIKWIK
ncbi:Peroxiredoxin [Bernardetia litoralis DSM 6794]|uniref:Peroxiredoxin n=1 Tax=Bernardetia litoralis (strain ATCC 23117 / DSM 6794 / NBRC 15988 / NCIMB 1366 / Fx l1 / Sio-4) TaxID=880071 RepID=I4AMI0_BERLS|nr:thioredoxin family protein [Bernardetia litoralis]AFM05165.1 Peroxiredoxin [Bernardetia litoralis DSM 6794]